MTIYEKIEIAKKTHSLNNKLLGEVVGDSEAGFGQIMRRKKMSSLKEQTLIAYLDKLDNMDLQKKENPSSLNEGYGVKEDVDKLIKENESLKLIAKEKINENAFLKQTVEALLKILGNK